MTDVYRWMREEELHAHTSKTIVTTAALMALRMLDKHERDSLMQWAKVIDDGVVTWQQFESIAGATAKQRGKALAGFVAEAVHAVGSEEAVKPAPERE